MTVVCTSRKEKTDYFGSKLQRVSGSGALRTSERDADIAVIDYTSYVLAQHQALLFSDSN